MTVKGITELLKERIKSHEVMRDLFARQGEHRYAYEYKIRIEAIEDIILFLESEKHYNELRKAYKLEEDKAIKDLIFPTEEEIEDMKKGL